MRLRLEGPKWFEAMTRKIRTTRRLTQVNQNFVSWEFLAGRPLFDRDQAILIIRGLLEKYPTFGRKKRHTWSAGNLITIKVVSLGLHTLLPECRQCWKHSEKASLEWCSASTAVAIIMSYLVWNSFPFNYLLEFGEQPDVSGSHIRSRGHCLWSPECPVRL